MESTLFTLEPDNMPDCQALTSGHGFFTQSGLGEMLNKVLSPATRDLYFEAVQRFFYPGTVPHRPLTNQFQLPLFPCRV